MKDGSSQTGSYNKRSSADVAKAFATPIPGMGNSGGGNGSSSGQSPTGSENARTRNLAPNRKEEPTSRPAGLAVNEMKNRGVGSKRINSLGAGCAGYLAREPKICHTTEKLLGIVETGNAAGTNNTGSGDKANPRWADKITFNEAGGIVLDATYSYDGISDDAARSYEEGMESWGSHGGSVNFRKAEQGQTSDLMISGITNRQMAYDTNLCDCMAGVFIGAKNKAPGLITINTETPFELPVNMAEHEVGHDFGLAHRGNGVMSYSGKTLKVRKEDIDSVRKLYSPK
jgi:hypothetical protein